MANREALLSTPTHRLSKKTMLSIIRKPVNTLSCRARKSPTTGTSRTIRSTPCTNSTAISASQTTQAFNQCIVDSSKHTKAHHDMLGLADILIAGLVRPGSSLAFASGLEQCERCALWIGNHRNTSHIFHRRRRQIKSCTKFLSLRRERVTVRNKEINLPVRWNVRIKMFRWRNPADEFFSISNVMVSVRWILISQETEVAGARN